MSQSSLEPALVAEVLNYTLTEFGGTRIASRIRPFTAGEVDEARAAPLLEITTTRAQVLGGQGLH